MPIKKKINLPFNPNKSLGQNFLLDNNCLQKIVNYLPINSNTTIIEIGSGYGHLTKFLADSNCRQIICLEKDEKLFNWLQKKQKKILFLHQDALKVEWKIFCDKYLENKSTSILVTGNLAYNIANDLIINLLAERKLFKYLIFLVQKEVAQRWSANVRKYKKEYSALSVYVNLIAETEVIFEISRNFFFPSPSVDGALISLKIKKNPLGIKDDHLANFLFFLKKCFHYRRKTLYNNLNIFFDKEQLIKTITDLGYKEKSRAQEISVEDYVILYMKFTEHNKKNLSDSF